MNLKILISDYDFELPVELIAQQPLPNRDDSRMMVIYRKEKKFEHRCFRDIINYFQEGEVIVINDTRVIPARTWASSKNHNDKIIEFLLLREIKPKIWEVLCRPARKVKEGDELIFDQELEAKVISRGPRGQRVLEFNTDKIQEKLREIGTPPLPPYIKRKKDDPRLRTIDRDRYQTVYAVREGSIAAPTAGLHFTENTLTELKKKGVQILAITLNVGLATFQPVKVEKITEHRMLEESFFISEKAASEISRAKKEHRPITAVGTTVVRTLESSWQDGRIKPGQGTTSLFIYPGYEFQVVNRLITNFHLPKSSLLMLVSAFAGYDLIMTAYREAVKEKYRFFSYGDCMLII